MKANLNNKEVDTLLFSYDLLLKVRRGIYSTEEEPFITEIYDGELESMRKIISKFNPLIKFNKETGEIK